jgi:Holliday junction resolvase RusA-like endonuclease
MSMHEIDHPGAWVLKLPAHTHSLNKLLTRNWRAAYGRKKQDREMVAIAALASGIPKAIGKRRIELEVILGPRQRGCDPDSYWKSLLDSLKHAGMIVDDSKNYVVLEPVKYIRGKTAQMRVYLSDIVRENYDEARVNFQED